MHVWVDPHFSLSTDPVSQSFCRSLTLLGALSAYPYMRNLSMLNHPPQPRPPQVMSWPQCPTPVQVPHITFYLRNHPDQEFASFIIQGLTHGFHIGYLSQLGALRSSARNHPSSLANRHIVSHYLTSEVSAGRMVDPSLTRTYQHIHSSPIGLVSKGGGTSGGG